MPIIYALSDSIGETAESVARAVSTQFDSAKFDIIRIPYINSVQQIEETIREASKKPCVICHTIVSLELQEALVECANRYSIPAIDVMSPIMKVLETLSGLQPKRQPGLIHKLDREYFQRVEAVEFAVKYDDGKNPWGFLTADIVLIGVSRTSKTPLSMYLAHKKVKVANLPLVPEVPAPEELFRVPSHKIVGLIIDPLKLNSIRSERLKIMGLDTDANYATLHRIQEEINYARAIMRKVRCPIIDVSNKAIEETANTILEIVRKNSHNYR